MRFFLCTKEKPCLVAAKQGSDFFWCNQLILAKGFVFMRKSDNKQYTRRESREKGENTPILPMSLKTDEVYVLENACQILGLSERFMKKSEYRT